VANEAALKIKAAIDPANAEIDRLKAKIIAIQDANKSASASARQFGHETTHEITEAKHAVQELGQEFKIKIPRALRNTLAELPALTEGLAAAFAPILFLPAAGVLEQIIERIPELEDAMFGFGETEKKVFDAYKKDNQEALRQSKELLQLQRNQVLAGLSGPSRTAKELQFQKDDLKLTQKQLDEKLAEFRKTGVELEKTISTRQVTPYASLVDKIAGKLGGTDIGGKAKEDLEALNVASRELNGTLALQKQEAKNTADTLRRDYAASLKEVKDKVTALITTPVLLTGENDAEIRRKFEAVAFDVQAAQKKGAISARAAAQEIEVVYAAMYRQLDKNAEQHSLNVMATNKAIADSGKQQIADILNAAQAQVRGPLDEIKDLHEQIVTALEAEKAQERELRDIAFASGEAQFITESKLATLRKQTTENLEDEIAQYKKLAAVIKDDATTNEAKKLGAEINSLNVKSRSLAQSIANDLKVKGTDAFASIVSGAQSAKEAFRSLALSMIEEIAKIIAQMLILRAVQTVVGLLNPAPSVASTAGLAPISSQFSGFNLVPGHASGGFFPANMPFIAGEEGPELILPSTSGRVAPNYAMRGSERGGTTI
jgi:hypothetical protein